MNSMLEISRRRFIAGTATAVAAGVSGATGLLGDVGPARAATALRIVTGGGNFEAALKVAMFDPYQAANANISITLDSPDDPARLKAMVEAGNVTVDLWLTGDFFGLDSDAQWLEPIDYNRFDASRILPEYKQRYRVGNDIEDTLITYRTDRFGGAKPKTFVDFFDKERFSGKRAVWKFASGGIFEAALLADGVPADKLFPIDVERALKKLTTIKDELIWWDSGAQAVQLMTSGEASLALVWGSRVFLMKDSAPVDWSWDQWISAGGWWMIPKGAKNQDETYKAMNYFLSRDPQVAMTAHLPYGPVNSEAAKSPDAKYKGHLPTDHLGTRVTADHAWWTKNVASVDEKFQEWLLT